MSRITIKSKRNPFLNAPPHEVIRVAKILKTLARGSRNTLAIYRELRNEAGFHNHHSFYRQFRFCLRHRLIELGKVKKKWGIPTKMYHLTERGENFLELFKDRVELLQRL